MGIGSGNIGRGVNTENSVQYDEECFANLFDDGNSSTVAEYCSCGTKSRTSSNCSKHESKTLSSNLSPD